MKIQIDLPREFEQDFAQDKFRDFFARALADIDFCGACGQYERETALMLMTAFAEAVKVPKE